MNRFLGALALCVGFLWGSVAGAATSVVSAPPGWTLITTLTPSAAASAVFSSIPQTYSELLVIASPITTGSVATVTCTLSSNGGSNYTAAGFGLGNIGGFAGSFYGGFVLVNYRTGSVGIYGVNSPTSTAMSAPQLSTQQTSVTGNNGEGFALMSAGINNILCAPSTGTFTGTLTLYGR